MRGNTPRKLGTINSDHRRRVQFLIYCAVLPDGAGGGGGAGLDSFSKSACCAEKTYSPKGILVSSNPKSLAMIDGDWLS